MQGTQVETWWRSGAPIWHSSDRPQLSCLTRGGICADARDEGQGGFGADQRWADAALLRTRAASEGGLSRLGVVAGRHERARRGGGSGGDADVRLFTSRQPHYRSCRARHRDLPGANGYRPDARLSSDTPPILHPLFPLQQQPATLSVPPAPGRLPRRAQFSLRRFREQTNGCRRAGRQEEERKIQRGDHLLLLGPPAPDALFSLQPSHLSTRPLESPMYLTTPSPHTGFHPRSTPTLKVKPPSQSPGATRTAKLS